MPVSHWLQNVLFRSEFEHACSSFAIKVLFRSERHLMFLRRISGHWAGDGGPDNADARPPSRRWLPTEYDLLAVPFMLAFFVVTGLRFVFDMPAALDANWIFRSAALTRTRYRSPSSGKLMLLGCRALGNRWRSPSLPAQRFGWEIALEHTAIGDRS